MVNTNTDDSRSITSKSAPFKSNSKANKAASDLHTVMAHLRRPSPYDPPCHDMNDKELPLDYKSACLRYGIEGECILLCDVPTVLHV